MKCKVVGEFLEKGKYQKKDGTMLHYIKILSGSDSIQINDCVLQQDYKRLQQIEIDCDVKSSQYGLMITAINN